MSVRVIVYAVLDVMRALVIMNGIAIVISLLTVYYDHSNRVNTVLDKGIAQLLPLKMPKSLMILSHCLQAK